MAGCYILHHESPFYFRNGIYPGDAFSNRCLDIATLREDGKVIVMGDWNACVGYMQFQPIVQDEMDKSEAIEIVPLWYRSSADGMVELYGRAHRCMVNGMHILTITGMNPFIGTK